MTPREKEIALEAAGRSVDPVAHAKKLIEAAAFLRGERPPFVCWPKRKSEHSGDFISALDLHEMAAWLEAQAAELRERAVHASEFMQRGSQGGL
nr:hypothetical protein [uncultured Pseudomonas sp.]